MPKLIIFCNHYDAEFWVAEEPLTKLQGKGATKEEAKRDLRDKLLTYFIDNRIDEMEF